MRVVSNGPAALALAAMLALPMAGGLSAQEQGTSDPTILVQGAAMTKGPDIKGIITARTGDRMKVTAADGTSTVIAITPETRIRGGGKRGAEALLNGLPVTVKTMQAGDVLVASQVSFRGGDLKTATMIRGGTAQQFEEQAAATEALRGRMADIDKYNIKSTTNVYFNTGQATLSPSAKAELCTAAAEAEKIDNALMLVVGYTDSVGSEEFNQILSERRAARVINYLQQSCRWKPYRMLTPTGMAEADPLASNDTAEGKAQNRRVSVNVLVSKGLDGL